MDSFADAPLMLELVPDVIHGGYTARLPDVPAYGEGETPEEAMEDLRAALTGYIETFGLDDALSRIVKPELREADWNLQELARA